MKSNFTGRYILIAALVAAIAVPVFNTAVIGSVTTVLASDVMTPPIISAVLSFLSEFITLASAFAAAAYLSFACVTGILRRYIILITALSGIPTMVGALLGFLLGEIGAVGLAISLGFASGAMLYVVFGEILPQAILMYHSKLPAFAAIGGILVGMLIIFA